jgi:hypothetical protein
VRRLLHLLFGAETLADSVKIDSAEAGAVLLETATLVLAPLLATVPATRAARGVVLVLSHGDMLAQLASVTGRWV